MNRFIVSILFCTALISLSLCDAAAQQDASSTPSQIKGGDGNVVPHENVAEDSSDAPVEFVKPIDRYKSVMMSPRAQDWIRRAIKSYETKIPVAVLMPDVFPTEIYDSADIKDIPPPGDFKEPSLDIAPPVVSQIIEEHLPPPIPPETISFKSFVRLGDLRWVAWINDRKITDTKSRDVFAESGITIERMRDERLFFIWKNSQISRMLPDWNSDLARIGETDFYTDGRNIIVDAHTENIGFFLSPGDSFNGERLIVYSGDNIPENIIDNMGLTPAEAIHQEAVLAAVQGLKKDASVGGNILNSDETISFEEIATAGNEIGSVPVVEDEKSPTLPVYMSVKDRKHLLTLYAILIKEEE